jgi:hypothetical protein
MSIRRLIAMLALVGSSCDGPNRSQPPFCNAGDSIECMCDDGSPGTATCLPDGTAYDVCMCVAQIDGGQSDVTAPPDFGVDISMPRDSARTDSRISDAPASFDVPDTSWCPAPQTICAYNTCTHLDSDIRNCGCCGNSCIDGACVSGVCMCPSGLVECVSGSGCAQSHNCYDFQTSIYACGGCNQRCGTGDSCRNGVCTPNG